MKIWFPTLRVNTGVDVFTQRLASGLQQHGVDAEITWFNRNYEFAPSLLKRHAPPKGTSAIHTNSSNGFAFKRADLPLVVTKHDYSTDRLLNEYRSVWRKLYHSMLIKNFEHLSFKSASAITTVSHFTASVMSRSKCPLTPTVIHNSVPLNRFIPAGEPKCGVGGQFRLLYVGNWSKRKGVDLLFPIMESLGSDFNLRIVSNLNQMSLHPSDNMTVVGPLDQTSIITEYQQCDALITTSRSEAFGYTALEAMACGRPVIATNNTALPEVVGDTGLLCDVDDVGQFVDAARFLKNHPDEARSLGKAARDRAEALFSEERMIEQYVRLYESLLS
jgi:glycosyltransferase involved in cell wall biosynthesis